jgi:hypothetical protein
MYVFYNTHSQLSDCTQRSWETHTVIITQRLGYGQDDRGSRVQFPAGTGNFSLHHRVQNGSGALYLGVKRPGREADHSSPSSAEVKE